MCVISNGKNLERERGERWGKFFVSFEYTEKFLGKLENVFFKNRLIFLFVMVIFFERLGFLLKIFLVSYLRKEV